MNVKCDHCELQYQYNYYVWFGDDPKIALRYDFATGPTKVKTAMCLDMDMNGPKLKLHKEAIADAGEALFKGVFVWAHKDAEESYGSFKSYCTACIPGDLL